MVALLDNVRRVRLVNPASADISPLDPLLISNRVNVVRLEKSDSLDVLLTKSYIIKVVRCVRFPNVEVSPATLVAKL